MNYDDWKSTEPPSPEDSIEGEIVEEEYPEWETTWDATVDDMVKLDEERREKREKFVHDISKEDK